MKSTVPVGTGAAIKRGLREQGKIERALRVLPGVPQEGTQSPTSCTPTASWSATTATGRATRSPIVLAAGGRRWCAPTSATAEMVKLASNAFLATKISFINEIANVCEETGADVLEVARGMGLDQRIGKHFLQPGIGFGGSCFPKDVSALKQLAGNSGYHFQLLNAVIEVNELQKRRVDRQAPEAPRLAGGQDDRAAWASRSSQHRRHARGLLAGARPPASRPTGATVRPHDPVAGDEAQRDDAGRRAWPRRPRGDRRGRRGRARHRVAASSPSWTGSRPPMDAQVTSWWTDGTSSSRCRPGAGLRYEGDRPAKRMRRTLQDMRKL